MREGLGSARPRRGSRAGHHRVAPVEPGDRRSGDRIAVDPRPANGISGSTGTAAPHRLRRCSREHHGGGGGGRRVRLSADCETIPRARRWRRAPTAGACRRRRCRHRLQTRNVGRAVQLEGAADAKRRFSVGVRQHGSAVRRSKDSSSRASRPIAAGTRESGNRVSGIW